METFRIIRDRDFGLNMSEPTTWDERKTSRAIIFDRDKNVALLCVSKKHYHKLPGGGVEKGETVNEALKREALEEIGCDISNIRELGIVEEYRGQFSKHQTSYCFVAEVEGEKKNPNFTPKELENGFEIIWLPLKEAIETLESEMNVEDYGGKFINARELIFLKEANKILVRK